MLDAFFIAVTTYGNPLLYLIVSVLLIMQYRKTHIIPKREIFILIVGFLIRTVLVEGIRVIHPIPRPFVANHTVPLIPHEESNSFPSGHASTAFLFVTFLYWKNKSIGALSAILALLIAYSRVYVGVHYPIDVIAGAGVGIVSFYVSNMTTKFIDKTKLLS